VTTGKRLYAGRIFSNNLPVETIPIQQRFSCKPEFETCGTRKEKRFLAQTRSGGESTAVGWSLSAGSAETADFGARNRDFEVAIEGNLLLQILIKLTFEFAYLAAANAGDMNMIARPMTLIKVSMTAEVKQVEFVNQAQLLEHFEGAIDGDARDGRIDFLGAGEDFVRVKMLRRALDHLQQGPALAREADPAGSEFALQAAQGLRGIDAFTG
jgi:hypothetical protein